MDWSFRRLDHHKGIQVSTFVDALEKSLALQMGKPPKKDPRKTPAPPKDQKKGSDKNKPGSAKNPSGGIELSKEQESALKNKAQEHNSKYSEKSKRVTLGMLKAVWRRGAGAFSVSHRPGQSRSSWAMARVNAFLYLVKNGRPSNPNYVQDNDLLPSGHPKKS
jgi:hypothetical protein